MNYAEEDIDEEDKGEEEVNYTEENSDGEDGGGGSELCRRGQ